jgi:hypothetical protein
VPEAFIPKTGIRFDELEDAYIFYCDCAKLVGFDVRKDPKRPQVAWYVCSKEGFCNSKKEDKQIEKGSKCIGCKSYVKVKFDTKGCYWYFDIVALNHNHPMSPQQRMVRFMHAHKSMEDGVKNLMDVMTQAGVQH